MLGHNPQEGAINFWGIPRWGSHSSIHSIHIHKYLRQFRYSYWWRARHVGVFKPLFRTSQKCWNMGVTGELASVLIRQFLHSYWSRATAETVVAIELYILTRALTCSAFWSHPVRRHVWCVAWILNFKRTHTLPRLFYIRRVRLRTQLSTRVRPRYENRNFDLVAVLKKR